MMLVKYVTANFLQIGCFCALPLIIERRLIVKKETHGEIRRDLKTRHLSMIAIGGSIGTGLF